MDKELIGILKGLLPTVPPLVILIAVILFMPEKVEKWSAMIWKLLSTVGVLFRGAHKRYIKHDLQGRVNSFVKNLQGVVPALAAERVEIEWVDQRIDRAALLADGKVVIRLRREDPEEHNFIHGAYLFISGSLLRRAKRYLSPSQREALDLFVCARLLEVEKPGAHEIFVEQYLHPRTDDAKSKVALLVDDFAIIDQGSLFFPVFLQELHFLGNKVFGRRRNDLIITEVNELVSFLKPIASRKIGQEGDLHHQGEYCRFGLVIVGKPEKLDFSTDPYVRYIRFRFLPKKTETIYVLGLRENRAKLQEICKAFAADYECLRTLEVVGPLRYRWGTKLAAQSLFVLRRRVIPPVEPSDRLPPLEAIENIQEDAR